MLKEDTVKKKKKHLFTMKPTHDIRREDWRLSMPSSTMKILGLTSAFYTTVWLDAQIGLVNRRALFSVFYCVLFDDVGLSHNCYIQLWAKFDHEHHHHILCLYSSPKTPLQGSWRKKMLIIHIHYTRNSYTLQTMLRMCLTLCNQLTEAVCVYSLS